MFLDRFLLCGTPTILAIWNSDRWAIENERNNRGRVWSICISELESCCRKSYCLHNLDTCFGELFAEGDYIKGDMAVIIGWFSATEYPPNFPNLIFLIHLF